MMEMIILPIPKAQQKKIKSLKELIEIDYLKLKRKQLLHSKQDV